MIAKEIVPSTFQSKSSNTVGSVLGWVSIALPVAAITWAVVDWGSKHHTAPSVLAGLGLLASLCGLMTAAVYKSRASRSVIGMVLSLTALVGFGVHYGSQPFDDSTRSKTFAEIRDFEAALQAFQTDFKVAYIPSKIMLCERLGDNGGNGPLAADSKAYLLSLFPRIAEKWQTEFIDWNGDGKPSPPVVLEGDQCLVFFLGGIPLKNPPGCFGFSGDGKNPANLAMTKERKGPFFDFRSDRLRDRSGNGFWSYNDPYGQNDPAKDKPYAYFGVHSNGKFDAEDCASLGAKPYILGENLPRFHMSRGFQIISAGADRTFGPGGLWSPETASKIAPAGADDQTNFHNGLMGGGK
ncbi:MAG TPA: hypothetical protein VE988_03565 [Gemmataceae bacterium]|nr:hypothetical protein [Gemmataceae bacterium]